LPSIFLFLFTCNKGNERPNEGLISKHTRRDTYSPTHSRIGKGRK